MIQPPPPNPNQSGKPPSPNATPPTPESKPEKKPPRKRAKPLSSSPDKPILAPGTHWLDIDSPPVHQTMEQFAADVWGRMHYLGMRTKALRERVTEESMALNIMRFYRRGGVLVTIDERHARAVPVSARAMRIHIEKWIPIEAWPKPRPGMSPECERRVCTIEWAEAVIEHPNIPQSGSALHVHELVALAPHPLIAPDGTIYDRPRLLDDGRALWVPKITLDADPISFWDVVSDFPIVESSKGNLLALVYTVLFRQMLQDNAPLFLIISSLERSGKTKLFQQVLGGLLLGRPATLMQWPQRDEEVEKVITSMLLQGEALGCIDNVPERLDSAALASVITSMRHGGRKLGESTYLHMDNTLTLVATGNHTRCSAEIAKRSCTTILQPGCDNPELRRDFKHTRIYSYVLHNRAGILRWLLDGVRAWVAAGCPRTKQVLGGFETWMETVGSLCEFLGYPVLQNREEMLSDMDNDQGDLEKLVEVWAHIHESEWVQMTALLPLARIENVNVWPHLLERAPTDRGKCIALAQKLRSFVGRTVKGWRIERRGSGSERFYRLAKLDATPQ